MAPQGAPVAPSATASATGLSVAQRARDLDVAGEDLLRDVVERRDQRVPVGRVGAHLAVADAAVRDVVQRVATALERIFQQRVDRVENRDVDLFRRAREDVRAEERLVVVDTDPPDAALVRRLERAEAAAARRGEHGLRAALDLRERELLALRLVDEVLRVPLKHGHARVRRLHAGAVAGEERDDRRNGLTADRAHGGAFRDRRGRDADEITRLLLGEDQPPGVCRLVLQRGPREVDDRELRVGKLRRDARERVAHQEADADHEVVPTPGRLREVGDVVARGIRDEHAPVDPELILRTLEARVRERVEAPVVQAPDVGDERDAEVRAPAPAPCLTRALVASAAARGRKQREDA